MLSQTVTTAVIAVQADRIMRRDYGAPQAITRDDWGVVWREAAHPSTEDNAIQFDVLTALCECGWAFID